MQTTTRNLIGISCAIALTTGLTLIASADEPPMVQVNAINYVTGGIGDEERKSLQAVKNDYNLRIVSSSAFGAFEGDTHILIRNAKGAEVLNVPDAGPIFLAKLPVGVYSVVAANEGQLKRQKISINGSEPARVHFSWK